MHLVPLLFTLVALFVAVGAALWNLGFLHELPPRARAAGIAAFLVAYVACQTVLSGHVPAATAALSRLGDALARSRASEAIAAHASSFTLWSVVMFGACIVAALRLVTFRRGPSRHRLFYAWLSWFYVVALTAVAIKIACGVRPPPGPIEALGCVAIAGLFLVHRGNLAHLHRAARRAFAALVFGSAP